MTAPSVSERSSPPPTGDSDAGIARRGQRLPAIAGLGTAVVSVLLLAGAILWVTGSDGTKQAELGAGLVSTGVFGLLILLIERALYEQTVEVDRKASLAAVPQPAKDTAIDAPDTSEPPSRREEEPVTSVSPPRHRFKVMVDTWMRDSSRIDADQLRLRVLRDGEYFQFFTAVVPGTELRTAIHGAGADGITLAQLRRAIGDLAVELVRQTIIDGNAPRLDDRTIAIELFPDVHHAVGLARYRRDQDHEHGDVIAEWSQ